MDVGALVRYAKSRPVVAGGAALAGIAAMGGIFLRGRGGGDAAPSASMGVVGDKTAVDSGYPAVIVNQPAPTTPVPNVPTPITVAPGYVWRDGKAVGVQTIAGAGVPSCPAGYVAVKRADGQIVCTRQTDQGADQKRFLWFDPKRGSAPALRPKKK